MPLDNAKMTKPACHTCLETGIKCQTSMPRHKLHAWTVDTRGAYVRCLTIGLRYSCYRWFSACTFIHGHSFPNSSDFTGQASINEWIKYAVNKY